MHLLPLIKRRQNRTRLQHKRQSETIRFRVVSLDQFLEYEKGFVRSGMGFKKTSNERIIWKYTRIWDLGKDPFGVIEAAIGWKSCKSENFWENEGDCWRWKKRMSDDMAMDLLKDSQIWTFLNQWNESFFYFFQLFELWVTLYEG